MKSKEIHSNVWSLLSFATSEKNINQEYRTYMELSSKKLFAYKIEGEIVGWIGIEFWGFIYNHSLAIGILIKNPGRKCFLL